MARHTVNLGKARMVGRNKRAKKAVSVLKEELERRESEKVKISDEVNQKIWENGARQPPAKIRVETEPVEEGLLVKLSDTKEEVNQTKETDTTAESDYDQIVSGTISEAKDAISDLEDPDYDELIAAEENNKDRKTLIEHIESLK